MPRKNSIRRVKKLFKYQTQLVLLFVALFAFCNKSKADCREGVMIYEIYGGGGNSGAIFKNDFVVLYNSSSRDISLDGWLLQYASSAGTFTNDKASPLSGKIHAKRYYLIQEASESSTGSALPLADRSGLINLAASSAKVALVHSESVINSADPKAFEDMVAYSGGSSSKSLYRKNNSCLDTDTYSSDFGSHAPDPRNSLFEKSEIIIPENDVCVSGIELSEVYPFLNEFVEVKNIGSKKCDLVGWKISDQTNGRHDLLLGSTIDAGKYFAFVKDFGLNSTSLDGAKLYDPNNVLVDEITYSRPPAEDFSYSKNEDGNWIWTIKSPNEENIFKDDKKGAKKYFGNLRITELFPNPFESQYEEYIELFNDSDQDIDLNGWALHDSSKSGKYIFVQSLIIKSQKYLAIFKKDFKFALNNSGGEEVTLLDPYGNEVSRIGYDGTKRNTSFNFNGKSWHWSKLLTPGETNVFENMPKGEVELPEEVFIGVYAEFSMRGLDKNAKVTWNFGDDHKSYLVNTKHKYEKEGRYEGSVKYTQGSEDITENFFIDVVEIDHPEVRIVAISANPRGVDTGNEFLTIENKTKKKLNLLGWSIATGWKKLINHPIRNEFTIKGKKQKNITNDFSSFSLNNTKTKIELRYPDGKVAHRVKYKKEKGEIADGEVYQKVKGGWEWISMGTSEKSIKFTKQVSETIEQISLLSLQL